MFIECEIQNCLSCWESLLQLHRFLKSLLKSLKSLYMAKFEVAIKNFWIQRLETFYTQGKNHELNKIRHWSCLYFTIQNQFVWGSSSVKNWKMASSSWKIYLRSNKFIEFRTWKVLLKNTTTNMGCKILFFTSSAPLTSVFFI